MRRVLRPIRRLGRLGDVALLSPADITTFAANAGFSGPDLSTAVAIALAESFPSGNPNSYNPETKAPGGTPIGQGSYGLWQIYLKKHPEFAGQNLLDPQVNANAAYSIYARRGGFSDWATYNSGAYLAFQSDLPASSSPDGPLPGPLTLDASTGQPIDDSTPTPDLPYRGSPVFAPGSTDLFPTGLLGVAAAAAAIYFALEELS